MASRWSFTFQKVHGRCVHLVKSSSKSSHRYGCLEMMTACFTRRLRRLRLRSICHLLISPTNKLQPPYWNLYVPITLYKILKSLVFPIPFMSLDEWMIWFWILVVAIIGTFFTFVVSFNFCIIFHSTITINCLQLPEPATSLTLNTWWPTRLHFYPISGNESM